MGVDDNEMNRSEQTSSDASGAEPRSAYASPDGSGLRVHGPLRLLLLAILAVGLVGLAGELLLLEHTETFWQWIPLVLIGLGLVIVPVFAIRPTLVTLRAFQAVMVLMVVAGGLGLVLHYKGNVEFEREMAPNLSGMALFVKAMMGATPALAPGSLTQVGLVGLATTFRHPIRR